MISIFKSKIKYLYDSSLSFLKHLEGIFENNFWQMFQIIIFIFEKLISCDFKPNFFRNKYFWNYNFFKKIYIIANKFMILFIIDNLFNRNLNFFYTFLSCFNIFSKNWSSGFSSFIIKVISLFFCGLFFIYKYIKYNYDK